MAYWLSGAEATKKILAIADTDPPVRSRYFARGGLAVIRDSWDIDSAVAVIDAGRHGRLSCGHAHADALSCTLALGEQPLFIDRGTLTYIGPERNEFRASASHNTLEFDAESSVEPLGPFQWGPTPPRRPTAAIRDCNDMTIFRGTAWGHAGTTEPSTHSRVIVHSRAGAWVILDHGVRSERSRVVLRWQLAPGLVARPTSAHSFDVIDARGKPVARVAFPLANYVRSQVRDVSPRYGKRSSSVVLEAIADEHFRVASLILPAASLPTIEAMREDTNSETNSLKLLSWKDSFGEHSIALPKNPGASFVHAGWEAESELLWCVKRSLNRTDSRWQPNLLVAIGARRLVPPGSAVVDGLESELTGNDLVISNAPGSWTNIPLNDPQLGQEQD